MRELILEALRAREGATVRMDDLAAELGILRRDLEAELEALRLDGTPIVGRGRGVALTADLAELAAYCKARGRRAATIHRGTMALRRTLRLLEAQRAEAQLETLFASLPSAGYTVFVSAEAHDAIVVPYRVPAGRS